MKSVVNLLKSKEDKNDTPFQKAVKKGTYNTRGNSQGCRFRRTQSK